MKKIFTILALALPVVLTSCLKDEIYGGASFSNVKNTVAYTENDPVTVSATVTALVPVESVELRYTAGESGEQAVAMTKDGDTFSGVIPAQPLDTEVNYYLVASTASMTTASPVAKYTVGATPVDYSGLALNELNGNDKFIEILNTGKSDIPVSGVTIQKDGKDVWTGPAVVLKAGEYLLLYSVDVAAEHADLDQAYFFDSGLSAKKAVRVQMFDPKGNSLSDFNLIECAKAAPASYSRNADGKWYYSEATPGAANIEGTESVQGLEGGEPVKTPGSVRLNELNGNDKFIELYNPGDEEFAIEGYKIQKDGTDVWTAPAGCKLAAKGFLLLYSADVTADHSEQPADMFFTSGLSAKKAVKVELFDAMAASVSVFNYVTYSGTPAPASYGVNADGKWYYQAATPGAANADGTDAVTGLE